MSRDGTRIAIVAFVGIDVGIALWRIRDIAAAINDLSYALLPAVIMLCVAFAFSS